MRIKSKIINWLGDCAKQQTESHLFPFCHTFYSQSSLDKLESIEKNDCQKNTHSAAAYALSSSYQGGYSSASNGTQMAVTHGKRVRSSCHRLEEQQDEFFQL